MIAEVIAQENPLHKWYKCLAAILIWVYDYIEVSPSCTMMMLTPFPAG